MGNTKIMKHNYKTDEEYYLHHPSKEYYLNHPSAKYIAEWLDITPEQALQQETNTKNLLDALTLDEIKKYLDTRPEIVMYKIKTIDSFVDELNERYEMKATKEQWEQACLEDGIQSFANLAYDFYDTFDENSYDPDLFEMTWQDMVEDEIEGAIKTLKRQNKLEQLID